MSKTVDERKAKWIAIATKWSKEHPDMMHKGIVCQKCGKPAYAVDLVTRTALCIECEADAIFGAESAMQEKPPFITEEMEVVYETAPKPDPTFDPPKVDLEKFPRFHNEVQKNP
jgi:hypothetical protein